ncbi:MAG: ABC transporter permease [Peptococcaceae bacterium]|jgi:simple sugar transport system permease protein|nr:ABC transporter permease [Peptococcaceae bacterium]
METAIATITTFLAASVRMAAPLTIAGIGEACSERTGVINIGLEAIMLLGAFCGFMVTFWTASSGLGMLAGAGGGMLVALLHGVLSVKCRANQNIVGLALNFLVLGLTSFLFLKAFGQSTVLPTCATVPTRAIPLLSRLPILGKAIFNQNIFVYIMLILVVGVSALFYKTEWGVNMTAVGEHPRAADTAGLNVFRVRYMACALNGLLGGLAGTYVTLAQLGFFMEDVTAGKGYMALVAVILGRRDPLRIMLASLLIGFAEAMQFQLQTMGIPVPSQVFSTIPYVAAVFALLFSIGKSRDPAALGVPYERARR